jgi:hypothetical protein
MGEGQDKSGKEDRRQGPKGRGAEPSSGMNRAANGSPCSGFTEGISPEDPKRRRVSQGIGSKVTKGKSGQNESWAVKAQVQAQSVC